MSTPFDFYKASLELWAEVTKDFQTGNQDWLGKALTTAHDDLTQTNSELQQLLQEQNWSALATLPQQAAWRSYVHQITLWQSAIAHLAQNQPDFSTGLQKTLSGWQGDSVRSFSEALSEISSPANLQKYWQPLFSSQAAAKTESADKQA